MSLLTGFPSVSDDSGLGQDGTSLSSTFFSAIKSAVEAVTHSATNPTVDPKDITDEVVTARGNKSDLNTRIAGVIDADGELTLPASVISSSDLQSALAGINLIPNDTFLLWPGGDAAAPSYWTKSGTPTLARTGTGLADTNRKVGKFAVSITNAGELYVELIDAAVWGSIDHLEGLKIGVGAWVKSSIASHARIQVDDGSGVLGNSSYHSGGGDWEWLSFVHTISATATYLRVQFDVVQNGTAYFSGPIAMIGDYAPDGWRPSPKAYGSAVFTWLGAPDTGDDQRRFIMARPGLVKDIQATAKTAAGANGLDIDIETWDGSAWQSVFTGEIIANTKNHGSVRPNGTYQYQCLGGYSGDTPTNNAMFRVNIDTADTVEDVTLMVRILQYLNPLEDFLAHDDY